MKKTILTLAAVLGVGLWVGIAQSGDEEYGEHPEMKPVELNEHHKVLHRSVGKWKVETKHWEPGQTEPAIGYGTSTCKKILDGRAVWFEVQTTSDQGEFKGFGVTTWNTLKQKYETSWVDIFSVDGLETGEGTWDETTETMTSNWIFTMHDGTKSPIRMVEKWESKNSFVLSFFMHITDDEEFKMMENTYTRVR